MDWKRKLTSRKFWMAIAAFVTGLISYINSPGDPTGLIMSLGAVVAYIVGEGLIDAADAKNSVYIENEPPDDSGTTGTLPSEGSENV